jgi:hypothetical protein
MLLSGKKKNVSARREKETKKGKMNRDRFHVMRAKAHLANHDANRAMRHLNKCKFGDEAPVKFGMRQMYSVLQQPGAPKPEGPTELTLKQKSWLASTAKERDEIQEQDKNKFDNLKKPFEVHARSSFGMRPLYRNKNFHFGGDPPEPEEAQPDAGAAEREVKISPARTKIAAFRDRYSSESPKQSNVAP